MHLLWLGGRHLSRTEVRHPCLHLPGAFIPSPSASLSEDYCSVSHRLKLFFFSTAHFLKLHGRCFLWVKRLHVSQRPERLFVVVSYLLKVLIYGCIYLPEARQQEATCFQNYFVDAHPFLFTGSFITVPCAVEMKLIHLECALYC